jgi:hypothetical protein
LKFSKILTLENFKHIKLCYFIIYKYRYYFDACHSSICLCISSITSLTPVASNFFNNFGVTSSGSTLPVYKAEPNSSKIPRKPAICVATGSVLKSNPKLGAVMEASLNALNSAHLSSGSFSCT